MSIYYIWHYKIIKLNPINKEIVRYTIPLEILPSSFFAKNNEIIGEVLKMVQPMLIGNVLNTICWSNIPTFVPSKIEAIKLIRSLFFNLFIKKFNLNFLMNNKKIIAPINLISVVIKGDISISKNTNLDSIAAKTAQKIDKKEYK